MALLDFPDPSASPYIGTNGVVYTYVGIAPNGYWSGTNSVDANNDLKAQFVEVAGDNMTGDLTLGPDGGPAEITLDATDGNATFAGGNYEIYPDGASIVKGAINVYRDIGTNAGLIIGEGSTNNTILKADGSATFASGITSGFSNGLGYINTAGQGGLYGYFFARETGSNNTVALNYKDNNASLAAFIAQDSSLNTLAKIGWDGSADFLGRVLANDRFLCQGVGSQTKWQTDNYDLTLSTVDTGGSFVEALRITGQVNAGAGDILIGGTLPDAPNITLNADGGISSKLTGSNYNVFLGQPSIGGLPTIYCAPSVGAVGSWGVNTDIGSSTAVSWMSNDGGTTKTISLNSDGSGTFSGIVDVERLNAGSLSHTTPAITATTETTSDAAVYSRNNAGTTAACYVAAGGDGSAKATINNDGSALFASDVQIGANAGSSASNTTGAYVSASSGSFTAFKSDSNSSSFFRGIKFGSGTPFEIFNDGSATFAGGDIILNADGNATFTRDAGSGLPVGVVGINSSSGNSDGFSGIGTPSLGLSVKESGAANNSGCFIAANGNWYFSGTGNTRNITIEDDAGAELNVRERLVAARETFQELQVAVANATDFAGLKAAMLVALEDYAA